MASALTVHSIAVESNQTKEMTMADFSSVQRQIEQRVSQDCQAFFAEQDDLLSTLQRLQKQLARAQEFHSYAQGLDDTFAAHRALSKIVEINALIDDVEERLDRLPYLYETDFFGLTNEETALVNQFIAPGGSAQFTFRLIANPMATDSAYGVEVHTYYRPQVQAA